MEAYWRGIDVYKWRNELIWKEYSERIRPSIENYPYEIYAEWMIHKKYVPPQFCRLIDY